MIFSALGWIGIAETSLIGLRFTDGSFGPVLLVLLSISLAAQIVQWLGDWSSLRGWNVAGRQLSGPYWDGRSDVSRLAKLCDKLRSLERSPFNDGTAINPDVIKQISTEIPDFLRSVKDFGRFAKFYIHVWYMAVHILTGLLAVLWQVYG